MFQKKIYEGGCTVTQIQRRIIRKKKQTNKRERERE